MASTVDSLVCRDGKRTCDVFNDDIGELVKQAGTFVWLGMHEPDDWQLLRIQNVFGLHELAIEDAHQRPKIEAYSNSLFIVLKTAQLEAGQVVYEGPGIMTGTNGSVLNVLVIDDPDNSGENLSNPNLNVTLYHYTVSAVPELAG